MPGFVIVVAAVVVMLYFLYWAAKDPRGIWRATHGWKYRDPAAHEPSAEEYAESSAGAVIVFVFILLCVGAMVGLWFQTRADEKRFAEEEDPRPSFLHSQREDRGPLPVVGYRVTPQGEIEIEYAPGIDLRPENRLLAIAWSDVGCFAEEQGIDNKEQTVLTVRVDGYYQRPSTTPQDAPKPVCEFNADLSSSPVHTLTFVAGRATPGRTVVTDSPIIDRTTKKMVVAPAGRPNSVPLLPAREQ